MAHRSRVRSSQCGEPGPYRFYVYGAVGKGVLRAVERSLRTAALDAVGPRFGALLNSDERVEHAFWHEFGHISSVKRRILVHALYADSTEENPALPDHRFVLPARYVKGAYDRLNGEIVRNRGFRPHALDHERLARNIERLLD